MFVSSSQHLFLVRICGQLQYHSSSQQDLSVPILWGWFTRPFISSPGAATTSPSLSLTFHFLVGMKLTGNHKQMDTRGR